MRQAVMAVLVMVACAACGGGDAGEEAPESAVADTAAAEPAAPVDVTDAGFETPESVLHDETADVYLVSNIAGDPVGRDDNGFISRVTPDGAVEALRWIDGAAESVTLHAPKGMALSGDTLFVTDIDAVRLFDRATGRPLGERAVPGATFLNDLAIAPDGTLYVSDTGMGEGFQPTGTDAVHRFDGDAPVELVAGAALASPNGLAATDEDVFVAPFGAAAILRVGAGGGAVDTVATLPAGQLDGLVRLDDGTLIVSSWEAGALFRVTPDGSVGTLAEGLESPADIGYDRFRNRILVPLFMGNALRFVPVR